MARRLFGENLLSVMLPKSKLVRGEYYVGLCANATVARWNGEHFVHWRRKHAIGFPYIDFIETIKHPEDNTKWDVFVPVAQSDGHDIREIPIR